MFRQGRNCREETFVLLFRGSFELVVYREVNTLFYFFIFSGRTDGEHGGVDFYDVYVIRRREGKALGISGGVRQVWGFVSLGRVVFAGI